MRREWHWRWVPLAPHFTGSGPHFPARTLFGVLYRRVTANCSYFLFCPSSLPPTLHHHRHIRPHMLTPLPSFRHPNVLGNGISWSLLIINGHLCQVSLSLAHTHTQTRLPFHPALVKSLEKKQKRPCSSTAPFPPPPSLPSITHPCPLSVEQGGECWESPVSAQPVVVLGVSSDSPLFSPSPP